MWPWNWVLVSRTQACGTVSLQICPIKFYHMSWLSFSTLPQNKNNCTALRRLRSRAEGIRVPKWLQGQFSARSILVSKKQVYALLTLWLRSEQLEHPMSSWNDTELEVPTKESLSIRQAVLCTRLPSGKNYLYEVSNQRSMHMAMEPLHGCAHRPEWERENAVQKTSRS